MPFLDGELLSDREVGTAALCRWNRRLPVLIQLCRGLQHAHELQIIHRDLKPENVMLVPDTRPSGMRAVVMDFGLAKERRQDPRWPSSPLPASCWGRRSS